MFSKSKKKDQTRKLTTLTYLIDGTQIEIGRHPQLNSRKFVVRCNDVDGMSDEELLKELLPQKITSVRRITKKTATGIVGTPTLVLTINSTLVPEFINFGFVRVRTRLYYPLPLICRSCLKYGHPKSRCVAEKACVLCSGYHGSEHCTSEIPYCGNCKGNHSPLARDCPVYMYEAAVLKIKTEKNITLAAARNLVDMPNSSSYAAVVKYQNEIYNQQKKKKQEPKKITSSIMNSQKDEQQHQHQQQQPAHKRSHHPIDDSTSAVHLNVPSPPRKRSTPQATPQPSDDEAAEETQRDKLPIDTMARKLTSVDIPNPLQTPSSSFPNPFQPPYNLRNKTDPRHSNTFKK